MTKVIVEFARAHGRYNAGEKAGFDADMAEKLCSGESPVAKKIGTAKKPRAPKSPDQSALAGQSAELDRRATDLDGRETALNDREDVLNTRATALDDRVTDLDAREVALAARENQPPETGKTKPSGTPPKTKAK